MNYQQSLFSAALAFSLTACAVSAQSTDNYTLLKNATIIDMVDDNARKGDILLKNDVIEKVSYASSIKAPVGAVVYDYQDKFIMPGLIDNHVHITHGTYHDAVKQLNTALKNGVTTVRDMGGDGRMLAQLKRATLIGEEQGADVHFSAIIAGKEFFESDPRPGQVALGADVGNVPWQWAVDENSDFSSMLAQTKGLGATAIKIYAKVSSPALNAVAKEAKKQGLQVWSHAAVAPTRPSEIISAGAGAVSHVGDFIAYELVDEVRDRYTFDSRQAAMAYRKSLRAIDFDENTPKVKSLFEAMRNNDVILDATLWVYQMRGDENRSLAQAQRVTKMAHNAGVKIGAGTDNIVDSSGYVANIHAEMKLLVDAGLSNVDALKAATVYNAMSLGKQDALGSIESSKIANLVVLDANPLDNIDNTRSVHSVIKRGKVLEGVSSMYVVKRQAR